MSAKSEARTLFSEDRAERHRAFIEHMEQGEQMIHRLRNWESDDIAWGWVVYRENGASMGKSYRRGDGVRPAHEEAQSVLESAPIPEAGGVLFVWCGRVESVRAEGRDPSDPGEPPLKYAEFYDVQVYDSRILGDTDHESE